MWYTEARCTQLACKSSDSSVLERKYFCAGKALQQPTSQQLQQPTLQQLQQPLQQPKLQQLQQLQQPLQQPPAALVKHTL
jgi:hypothetical protein